MSMGKSEAPQFEVPVQRNREIWRKHQLKGREGDEPILALIGLGCPCQVAVFQAAGAIGLETYIECGFLKLIVNEISE